MDEEQSSFGIKKIVDCKIGEDGQQMYKVKWEPTWEPAANLITCQHLIDEFWSFVNIAKTNEKVAQEHRKRMSLEKSTNNVMNIDQTFNRMSNANKAEVHSLIARANATSTMQMSNPGPKSSNFGSPNHQGFGAGVSAQQNFGSPSQKGKLSTFGNKGNTPMLSTKVKADDMLNMNTTETKNLSNSSSLKYLENFSNPYVKIILVCKICNKEASKNSAIWKVHYLTHASNEDKPHKCHICNQGFVQSNNLKRHMKKHMKAQELVSEVSEVRHKDEANFKTESYY